MKRASGTSRAMIIKSARDFDRKYLKLKRKDKSLRNKVNLKLNILVVNPRHPSLRIHKLVSNRYEAWSISINMQLRILFVYRSYGILLIDIGGHDEVY